MGGAVAMVMVVGGTVVMVMFSDVMSLVMDRSGRGRSLDPSVTHLNQLSLRKNMAK